MRPARFALATSCLGQPLKAALTLASRLGANGVQLDARNEIKPSEMSATGRRQFLHLLSETGLQLASLDFPLRRRLWDAERLDARLEALKETMQFAYELKARTVTVRLGGLPDESDAAGQALLGNVLNDLARHGNRVGVTLAVGPGPGACRPAERSFGTSHRGTDWRQLRPGDGRDVGGLADGIAAGAPPVRRPCHDPRCGSGSGRRWRRSRRRTRRRSLGRNAGSAAGNRLRAAGSRSIGLKGTTARGTPAGPSSFSIPFTGAEDEGGAAWSSMKSSPSAPSHCG